MKISMENCHEERMRRRDVALYKAYKEALASGNTVTHSEAIQMALSSPQPKMWVPFYGVYRALLRIVRGSRQAPKGESRKNLLAEVERKYHALKEQRMFKGASLFFITSFIITEPSCGFYISEAHAKRIIWKMRKRQQALWRKNR